MSFRITTPQWGDLSCTICARSWSGLFGMIWLPRRLLHLLVLHSHLLLLLHLHLLLLLLLLLHLLVLVLLLRLLLLLLLLW